MTSVDVYNIAKALPENELFDLYCKLKNHFSELEHNKKSRSGNENSNFPFITNKEAQLYILETVFSKEKISRRTKNVDI
jgi:hypothetical protein